MSLATFRRPVKPATLTAQMIATVRARRELAPISGGAPTCPVAPISPTRPIRPRPTPRPQPRPMAHTAADEAWWSQASQETAADRWSREFDERMPEPVQAPCGTLGAWGGYDDRAGE